MPVEIEIEEANRRVVLRARGRVGDTEAREAITRLRELAVEREDFDLIADASEVDGWPLTTGTIRSIAADGLAFGPRSRRAYVMPSLLGYGLGRMYMAFAYDDKTSARLFRTYGEALAWLDPDAATERDS